MKALITGATKGIGRYLAQIIDRQGIELILTGRNEQELESLKVELKGVSKTIAADLNQKKGREELCTLISQECPDILINNAGFGMYGEFTTLTPNDIENLIAVNSTAVAELTHAAIIALKGAGRKGVILNVSSLSGDMVSPLMATYAACKAFVTHLSRTLDYEYKRYGIRVFVGRPGQVNTGFSTSAGGKRKESDGMVMDGHEVAHALWHQILYRQKDRIIDFRYALLYYLSKLLPTYFSASSIKKRIQARISP